jgi:hypothetical protein
MTHEQELLARAMSHIDDDMILAAHAPRKKIRRFVPYAVAACLIVAVALVFPYLRAVINVDSGFDRGDQNEEVGAMDPEKPLMTPQSTPVTLGGTTVTLTDTTHTTATFTVVKTDDTPIYAMLYDLREGALASTEPDYKDNGIVIRPNTIRLFVNGAEQPAYRFPTAPGTYEIVVDFTSIRNGTYPMREYVGLYAYIGEDGEAVTERFSLEVTVETDTSEPDTSEPDTSEPDTAETTATESETVSE